MRGVKSRPPPCHDDGAPCTTGRCGSGLQDVPIRAVPAPGVALGSSGLPFSLLGGMSMLLPFPSVFLSASLFRGCRQRRNLKII